MRNSEGTLKLVGRVWALNNEVGGIQTLASFMIDPQPSFSNDVLKSTPNVGSWSYIMEDENSLSSSSSLSLVKGLMPRQGFWLSRNMA